MVRYSYDAWGKHIAYDSYGYVISDEYHIGLLNPYRYRSYYYVDDGMYWLNTRFYDSTTGRFVSPDDLSYLDPDSVNGLNLYAYCANNPIAYVDPTGHSVIAAILIVAAIVGGGIAGVDANNHGIQGWELIGAIVLGAMIGVGTAGLIVAGIAGIVAGASAMLLVKIPMIFGVSASQAFSTGILAYSILPTIVGPLTGIAFPMIDNLPSGMNPDQYVPKNNATHTNNLPWYKK